MTAAAAAGEAAMWDAYEDGRPPTGHRDGWSVLLVFGMYALTFALPIRDSGFGGGFRLFVLGGYGTLWTLFTLPVHLVEGFPGTASWHDAEFFLLIACWLANPVFWCGLWQAACGRWRRAGIAALVAFALASIVGLLGFTHPPSYRHEYFGPAYLVWSGSMAWLGVTAVFQRLRV